MLSQSTLRYSLFLLISIILSSSSYAQRNFIKGEIVTLDNKIIEGQIDYENWQVNPKSISFKKNGDSKSISYAPEDISTVTKLN